MSKLGATAPCPPQGEMDWQRKGACLGADPRFFEPIRKRRYYSPADRSRVNAAARTFCDHCIVRDRCLSWAIVNRGWGVFGGRLLVRGQPVDLSRVREEST